MTRLALSIVSLALLAGCATSTQTPETERELATTQPSNVSVTSGDFDKLWSAADITSRDLLFRPVRQDRRAGVYETEPMISAQWFEPWRREVRTAVDRMQSSLGSIRRTLSVKIAKDANGTYVAKPIVVVERLSLVERRVTTSAGYKSVFRDRFTPTGSPESDAGVELAPTYWYEIGNDPHLEEYVAKAMEARLARP